MEPISCRKLLEPISCQSGKLMVQVTRAARFSWKIIGWEAGIRTPIGGFRVRSPTVRRPPNKEIQFTCSAAALSNAAQVLGLVFGL